jgi:hypothetical protein
MASSGGGDLAALQGRLQALLDPYAARLVPSTIYGLPTMRRADAKPSNWFAFVKPASQHVSLFLLPIHDHPELLDPLSPGLRRCVTGRSTITFRSMSDQDVSELERLLARAYAVYAAG